MSSPVADLEVEPAQVARSLDEDPSVQVVDVREDHEWEDGRIAGTRHIALGELTGRAATIDRARPVVFYCRVGARSAMAAQAFRASGYEAYSMRGGIVQWAAEGRPLEPDGGRVADH